MAKKLLMLPAYAKPEEAASAYLGRNRNEALFEKGIDIVSYAPTPTRGVSDEVRKEFKKDKKHWVIADGHMVIHRFSMFREPKNSLIRFIRYILCCFKQYHLGVHAKDAKDCGVLFVASTPPIQGVMAAMVKKARKIPFIYNLQDIFPDSLVGTGMANKNGILWKVGRMIEDYTYRHADKIIVISEGFKENIMAKGVPEDKIEVVYNWVDETAVVDVPRDKNTLFDEYSLDRSLFYVSYSGNIGHTQNMDMLLDVAKVIYKQCPDIRFVISGDGAYRKIVEKRVAEEGICNVILMPFQPYERISEVFSLGDAGLIISKPGVGENSVPSKTWSIMAASRPVLANFDKNELSRILRDHDCGVFTLAGDKEEFIAALKFLYENKERCVEMGQNGRKFIMENLTKDVGARRYAEIIDGFFK